ncbi:hypothetical protein GWK47_010684 [Chionoecetes opilio]|uniref:Uncharacterized protein n=1 Tax=Chionoecetes opilio TaxID=41210 RepID=A0A8J5CML5_CHIOP|nr:hypothetical protein GWK47_010684 [Chionoecetes opilio]
MLPTRGAPVGASRRSSSSEMSESRADRGLSDTLSSTSSSGLAADTFSFSHQARRLGCRLVLLVQAGSSARSVLHQPGGRAVAVLIHFVIHHPLRSA